MVDRSLGHSVGRSGSAGLDARYRGHIDNGGAFRGKEVVQLFGQKVGGIDVGTHHGTILLSGLVENFFSNIRADVVDEAVDIGSKDFFGSISQA